MLEYSFEILPKLSFDSNLFQKELKKLVSYLTNEEIKHLQIWLKENYHNEYVRSELVGVTA